MNILDIELSENASNLLESLFTKITTKTSYYKTKDKENPSYVVYNDNGDASIFTSDHFSKKEFERCILHETIHVYQKDNGFKTVKEIDLNNHQANMISRMMNSMILDMNVNFVLSHHKIFIGKNSIKDKYEHLKKDNSKFIKSNILKQFDKLTTLGLILQHLHIYFDLGKQQGEFLISQIDEYIPEYKAQCYEIVSLIQNGDISTNVGCNQVLESILSISKCQAAFKVID